MIFGKEKRKRAMPVMRLIFIVVFFILILPGVYARGQGGSSDGRAVNTDYLNAASEMPIVKEKITLELVVTKGPEQGASDAIWFWKWAEKEMNIHFNIAQVESINAREKINLMLASNELPDVFFGTSVFTTSDIFQYGQKEKQLIPLNGLIENHAPNLRAYLEQHPGAKAQSTCPDGNIYFLPGVNYQPQTYDCVRPWIHIGWLNKLGLKKPETLDELYEVLVAFRDRDPNGNGQKDEIPLEGGAKAMPNSMVIITAAMGFPEPGGIRPVVSSNGEVKLFAASPVYGEYLKYANRLFGEGLLDNEFYTHTAVQIRAKGSELRVGVHTDAAPFQMTPNQKDWSQYEALSPLTSQWNNTRVWLANNEIVTGRFLITNVCKYPEAGVRFGDFFFTEKGSVYEHYGPPKDHPDLMGMHNGWYFNDSGSVVYDRPAEYTSDQDYRLGVISGNPLPSFGNNDFNTPIEKMMGRKFVHAPNAKAWRDSMDIYIQPYQIPRYPVVYFDSDENDRVLELTSTLTDYMTAMDARFITGTEPLSNIPAYLERIRELGAAELEKIYQDAYAVYQRNLGQ